MKNPYDNPERDRRFVPGLPLPEATLLGTDGNIFAVLGTCTKALRKAKQYENATALENQVMQAENYDEALRICLRYVTPR